MMWFSFCFVYLSFWIVFASNEMESGCLKMQTIHHGFLFPLLFILVKKQLGRMCVCVWVYGKVRMEVFQFEWR